MIFPEFYAKWQGHEIEDAGSYNSPEALEFAADLRSVITGEFRKEDISLIRYKVGHYYVSGFACYKGRFGYFSYNFPQATLIDLDLKWASVHASSGFLYRTVKNPGDYVGGINHYTNLENLAKDMKKLLEAANNGD